MNNTLIGIILVFFGYVVITEICNDTIQKNRHNELVSKIDELQEQIDSLNQKLIHYEKVDYEEKLNNNEIH